jgi:N-acetylmuramoyl-L-alanine amidase
LPRLFLHTCFTVLLALFPLADAVAADITALRSWRAPDNTRFVIDLSGPVQYRLSPDSTPARVVVDIDGARPTGPLALPAVQAPLKSLRLEPTPRGQRLVIETTIELLPKIFQLPPNEKYGHRLVLDLFEKTSPRLALPEKMLNASGPAASPSPAKPGTPTLITVRPPPLPSAALPGEGAQPPESSPLVTVAPAVPAAITGGTSAPVGTDVPGRTAEGDAAALRPSPPELQPEPQAPEKYDARRFRNIIVAIDAGHGGDDPGAIGQDGTYEKHITLAIARELQARLEAEPGITAVLTRTGDYFIPLQERRRLARYQHKADIFVSIHADAAENRAARGASVFALSLKGAGTATSRFARMLAERENRADLIGGASLESEDNVLRNVLADMVVAGSLEHSLHMGRNILQGLGRIGKLHSPRVEQAGFAVLKEPGMMSLLVETGFISNPDEEKRLSSRQYQQELAAAVAAGVRRYCLQFPAPATYFAWHVDRSRAVAAERAPRRASPSAAAANGTGGATPAARGAVADTPVPVLVTTAAGRPGAERSLASGEPEAPRYRTHRVSRGDSLTRLAAQYGVPMATLRDTNRLRDDNLKIGQTLKIPVN